MGRALGPRNWWAVSNLLERFSKTCRAAKALQNDRLMSDIDDYWQHILYSMWINVPIKSMNDHTNILKRTSQTFAKFTYKMTKNLHFF